MFTSGYLEGGSYDNTFENLYYVMKMQIEENKDDENNGIQISWIKNTGFLVDKLYMLKVVDDII